MSIGSSGFEQLLFRFFLFGELIEETGECEVDGPIVFRMLVVEVESFGYKSIGFEFDTIFDAIPEVILFGVEHLAAQHAIEFWVHVPASVANRLHETDNVVGRRFGNGIVAFEFANHVTAAIATHVKGARIFEPGSAVVRPDGHVIDVGSGFHYLTQHLRVVIEDYGVSSSEIVAWAETS